MHLVGILTAAIGDLKLACLAESETKGEGAADGKGAKLTSENSLQLHQFMQAP